MNKHLLLQIGRVCFLRVTAYFLYPLDRGPHPNSEPSTRVCFLWVTDHFSSHGSNGPPSSLLHCPHICHLLISHASSQQPAMSSWSGDDASFGPALWTEQDPEFRSNFPVLGKRDFQSMRDVRSYAPNQPVNWPRCAHGEFCVMQVYQGWNNSGRRFWHCPFEWVSKATWLPSPYFLLVC